MAMPLTQRVTGRFSAWSSRGATSPYGHRSPQTFRAAFRRRWLLLAAVALILAVAHVRFDTPSWNLIGSIMAISVAANLLAVLVVQSGTYRSWFMHGAVAVDVAIACIPLVLLGSRGLIIGLAAAVLPYAFREGRLIGAMQIVVASGAYIGAITLHQTWFATPGTDQQSASDLMWIEGGAFLFAALFLQQLIGRLVDRIRSARDVLTQAADGALHVRSPGQTRDEIGLLERALNRMLDQVGSAITRVQTEADEVAVLSALLSQSAEGVLSSSAEVSEAARALASEMETQRQRAEIGQGRGGDAATEAATLRDRIATVASGANSLHESAKIGRERVQRAGETLVAIGENVQSTAGTVQTLNAMSERIGTFVHTISRIARQTHVLALNAAIEAARSTDSQEGFTTVAEEVRALAGEASASAREAAEVIEEVRSRIDSVARAMQTGREQVQNVGAIAAEAQAALGTLFDGASNVSELATAAKDIAREQAERLKNLSQRMSDVASASAHSSGRAQGAARAMSTQQHTIDDLNKLARQLAELSDRLRESVASFTVQPTDTN